MRKQAVAALFGLIPLLVHAQSFQTEKPVICSDLKSIVEFLSGPEYEEEPFWNGLGEGGSKYILMANPLTRTWTFIQYNDKMACVLGSGESGRLLRLGKSV